MTESLSSKTRRNSLRAATGLIAFAALLCGLQPADAKATPDAVTVASNEGVTLCRPRGTRCYIPQPTDPIFIGDVVETSSSGRLELKIPASSHTTLTHILVLPNSKIRFDRDTGQDFVEIAILHGTVAIEPSKGFDVTLGPLVCLINSGRTAITYSDKSDTASIGNVSSTCQCLSTKGGEYDIPAKTLVTIKKGLQTGQDPLAEGFWSKLTGAQ